MRHIPGGLHHVVVGLRRWHWHHVADLQPTKNSSQSSQYPYKIGAERSKKGEKGVKNHEKTVKTLEKQWKTMENRH